MYTTVQGCRNNLVYVVGKMFVLKRWLHWAANSSRLVKLGECVKVEQDGAENQHLS